MSGSGPLDGYYSQLGQLRSVTDGWRTMPGPVRPLSETTNELTQGAPTWADAWEHNKAAYQDWAEKQQQAGVAAGEIDPETGWPTPAGARSAATSTAMGLVMGSTAPEFKAPRIANPLRAYHGSPHEFPPTERNPLGEFDPARVGTGEGAQVYGVGAGYLAENEGIAQSYRDQLSGNQLFVDGQKVGEVGALGNDPVANAAHALVWHNGDQEAAREGIRKSMNARASGGYGFFKRDGEAVLKAIDDLGTSKIEVKPGGHMYEAEVHIDPEHMLHWDLPLSQQSKYVQERLSPENLGLKWAGPFPGPGYHGWVDANGKPAGGTLWKTSEPQPLFKADQTGQDIYRRLHDDKAAVSERLRDAGIPALRYRDANSRGENGQPQHNYVVFDPKHIDIVRRYGIGALIGGGAAVGAAQGEE